MQEFTTEGRTALCVPDGAGSAGNMPSKSPAFFNPRAKTNRDVSLLAYAALAAEYSPPLRYLDAMCGTGARGLRVANELDGFEVVLNDANPMAVRMAQTASKKNSLDAKVEFSNREACRFLGIHSEQGVRGTAVDVDPFGSPAKYFECAVRAVAHGGMLSATATDLQVLRGIFSEACARRYGGVPIRRAEFGDEIGVRLLFGCLGHICARIDCSMEPIFAHCDQHYYRIYARIKKHAAGSGAGYVYSCTSCGNCGTVQNACSMCPHCTARPDTAGPLWTGRIFDAEFVGRMIGASDRLGIADSCKSVLSKCAAECEMPPGYHTLDSTAKRAHRAPPKLQAALQRLQDSGYAASPTSFDPAGFRTDARMDQIMECIF